MSKTNSYRSVYEKELINQISRLEQEIDLSKSKSSIGIENDSIYEFTYELVNKIKERRIENGLSQEQLAKLAGVGRATIARLESWQYVSSSLTPIFKILNVLDLKLCVIEKTERRLNI